MTVLYTKPLNIMLDIGDSYVDPKTDPRMNIIPTILGNRHAPTTHAAAYELVHNAFRRCGLDIVNEVCAIDKSGARFFGIVQLASQYSDYSPIMAYRFAQDQSVARTLAGGSGVGICSNLCIWGSIKVARKQTTHMLEDLPTMYEKGIHKVLALNKEQDIILDSFKTAQITRETAYAAIASMQYDGIISPRHFRTVMDEWHSPTYDEHTEYGDSIWKLWNAVTFAYKPKNNGSIQDTLYARGPALMNLMQMLVKHKAKRKTSILLPAED